MSLHNTGATAARSGSLTLSGLRSSQKKQYFAHTRAVAGAIDTATVGNANRVQPSGGGNLTGGTITLLGR
jgi:hypothetical protein